MKRILSILASIACFAFVVGCSKNGPYENFPKADSLYQTVENPDKLDALRKSVGLLPIEEYLEIVKQQGVEIIYDSTKTVKDFE